MSVLIVAAVARVAVFVLPLGALGASALVLGVSLAGCPGARNLPSDSSAIDGDTSRPGFRDAGPLADLYARRDGTTGGDGLGDTAAPRCGAATCVGCCAADDSCQTGARDDSCGAGGSPCANCTLVSGTCQSNYCLGCTASCTGKTCGAGDGCGGSCAAGSGCCTPACGGKLCGAANGCGGTCAAGSGCCTPSCAGKVCGASDGCGGSCGKGSGCCTPSCASKICGEADGCGGACAVGSGCCDKKTEILDGKDNDCDNLVDEGFWVDTLSVSYGVLGAEHPGCTAASAHSDTCMSASHRYCSNQGFSSGFGPVEFGPSSGLVVCVADATVLSVPIATLTAEHGGCTASSWFSISCNAAIHRYCSKQPGYTSGAGPVEHSATISHFVCLKHSTGYQVSFAVLAGHHAGCVAANSFSPDCKAAIHRYCQSRGHHTGWGPVEQNADAFVRCLSKS